MDQSLEAMQVALRVLSELNEKRHPAAADIEALRALAGPLPDHTGLDEVACEVIQKALKRRAEVRANRR